MYLINNQPYIDLEPFVDMKGLEDIRKDIVLGMVKSKLYWQVGSADTSNLMHQTPPSIVNQAWASVLRDPKNPDYEYFKQFDFKLTDCLEWIKYTYKFQDMGELLSLRTWKKAEDVKYKFSAEHTFDQPAYDNFPSLRKWINNCTAFKEYGRILFWRNQSYQPGAIHKDTYLGSPDSFILINLDIDRKILFILDDEGKEIPVTSRVFIFDPRNWHGTRGLEYSGWTLRIDGVFDPTWAARVGLTDYLNSK